MNYLHWQKQFREALRTITDNFQINKKRKTLLEMSNETHREAGQLHHNMAKVERKTIWGRSPTCEGIELEFQSLKKKSLFKTRLHNMIHLTPANVQIHNLRQTSDQTSIFTLTYTSRHDCNCRQTFLTQKLPKL